MTIAAVISPKRCREVPSRAGLLRKAFCLCASRKIATPVKGSMPRSNSDSTDFGLNRYMP